MRLAASTSFAHKTTSLPFFFLSRWQRRWAFSLLIFPVRHSAPERKCVLVLSHEPELTANLTCQLLNSVSGLSCHCDGDERRKERVEQRRIIRINRRRPETRTLPLK